MMHKQLPAYSLAAKLTFNGNVKGTKAW